MSTQFTTLACSRTVPCEPGHWVLTPVQRLAPDWFAQNDVTAFTFVSATERYVYRRGNRARSISQPQDPKTCDPHVARRSEEARNAPEEQPALNLRLARTYLAACDLETADRTWQTVMDQVVELKSGATRERWCVVNMNNAFDFIRQVKIVETILDQLPAVLRAGGVATSAFLHLLHNFVINLNWLVWSVLLKRQCLPPAFARRGESASQHTAALSNEEGIQSSMPVTDCFGCLVGRRPRGHESDIYDHPETSSPSLG